MLLNSLSWISLLLKRIPGHWKYTIGTILLSVKSTKYSCRVSIVSVHPKSRQYIADLLGLSTPSIPTMRSTWQSFGHSSRYAVLINCSLSRGWIRKKKKRWHSPLTDTLNSWTPTKEDKVELFGVTKAFWELYFKGEENMKTIERKWEFFINTAHLWNKSIT